jgi:hypothetical protein
MTTLDVLIAARAEVEKGWTQGRPCDEHGNVCAMGALTRVLGEELRTTISAAPAAVYDSDACYALEAVCPDEWVQRFNDLPDTTQADVIALFDRAINAEAVKVTADPAHTFLVA